MRKTPSSPERGGGALNRLAGRAALIAVLTGTAGCEKSGNQSTAQPTESAETAECIGSPDSPTCVDDCEMYSVCSETQCAEHCQSNAPAPASSEPLANTTPAVPTAPTPEKMEVDINLDKKENPAQTVEKPETPNASIKELAPWGGIALLLATLGGGLISEHRRRKSLSEEVGALSGRTKQLSNENEISRTVFKLLANRDPKATSQLYRELAELMEFSPHSDQWERVLRYIKDARQDDLEVTSFRGGNDVGKGTVPPSDPPPASTSQEPLPSFRSDDRSEDDELTQTNVIPETRELKYARELADTQARTANADPDEIDRLIQEDEAKAREEKHPPPLPERE